MRIDADLASVRGQALDRLPRSEAGQWRSFWTEVDAAIELAGRAR